jgi:hypothetical protein
MSRLRLPHLSFARPVAGAPPPTPGEAVRILLGRRAFLHALGAATVLLLAPWTRVERAWAAARGRFFTKRERLTLYALLDTSSRPTETPGAAVWARYIENLLYRRRAPAPPLRRRSFSNRNPFIDFATGTPAKRRPRNAFKRFVAPNRLQDLYWRWQVVGTDALRRTTFAGRAAERSSAEHHSPGCAPSAGGGPRSSTRSRAHERRAPSPISTPLPRAARDALPARSSADLAATDATSSSIVVQHTIEGCSRPRIRRQSPGGGWR